AKVLSEEMGITATTVARKLVSNPLSEEESQQQIWIVDEAGLLGAKDAYSLLKRAEEEQARVLLVGDTRQLSSVAAGNPFKSLQQAGIATAYLNQSLRQKTRDLKKAVDLLSDGALSSGIKILEENGRIQEIDSAESRADKIASDYLSLTPDERKQTLIIAGTHTERSSVLSSIRNGLKGEGSLGEEVGTKRLKSLNLTSIQKKYAHYYSKGNVIIPLANYKRLGLEKNKQYKVKAVEKDTLVLNNNNGDEFRVSPASFKYKEVYSAIDTDIAVGERLRWGKNDKELNRVNGEEFVVTQIKDGVATIATETGKEETIDLKFPQHLDHALVSTTYSSQGVTANRVLASVTNDLTLSRESFYVAASRAKYNLQLYVENKQGIVEKASETRSQKNPLELIQEHQRDTVVTSLETTRAKLEEAPVKKGLHKGIESRKIPYPQINQPSQEYTTNIPENPSPQQLDNNTTENPSPQQLDNNTTENPSPQQLDNNISLDSTRSELDTNIPEPSAHEQSPSNAQTPSIPEETNSNIPTPAQPQEKQPLIRKMSATAYTDVSDKILENLERLNPSYKETLKLQAEKLTTQIETLDNSSKFDKKKQRRKKFFKEELLNILAFTKL
ncbi:MAG: AAA family ATPase, partial [Xenococcaceae cyanobacterium MO_167.B27]|nr:AAA family ATPase [Xenococcaceae cyanobacterium MO_167.B27]